MKPSILWLHILSSALPLVLASSEAKNASDTLFWGTYRPNLYFGLKPRLPQSLMTGLMWFGTQDYQSFGQARHSCEQGDNLDGYSWKEHDLREGGIQVLKDGRNNIEIKTEWLKFPGGSHGGSWAARISGQPMDKEKPCRNSFIFYFGMEGLGGLGFDDANDNTGIEGTVILTGSSPDLGNFRIRIEDDPKNNPITEGALREVFGDNIGKNQYVGIELPAGNTWRAKEVLQQSIVQYAQPIASQYPENPPDASFILRLPNTVAQVSNFLAVQKFFDGSFSFDIYYEAEDANQKLDAAKLTQGMKQFSSSYTQRFVETFPLPPTSPPSHLEFSKAMTANMMGGIGHFFGTSIEDRSFAHEWDDDEGLETEEERKNKAKPMMTEPRQLLTATPSRSFFPRGFYWDEGFHLALIGSWDNDLSLEILQSWIGLIDEDGWVGREQILGDEARSKVPSEFQTQYPTYANPPTLAMAVTAFINRLRENSDPLADQLGMNQVPLGQQAKQTSTPATQILSSPEASRTYLKSIYPALRRHYDWFRRTQKGQIKQWGRKARSRTEGYRWRGRTEEHVLTSGMDDYPRATPPHMGELHVDLISWVAFFTRTMRDIAEFAGEAEDEAEFKLIEEAVLKNLDDLHWNEEEKMYCDLSIDGDEESIYVCHKGYLSLFPLLLGLLSPDSPHLGPILDMLHSPDHLWSPYGLRSLSVSHPLFGQGENYWRGPIWIQMNYLALSSLKKIYAAQPGPHQQRAQKIYDELRNNVINNVYKEYERTGYVWEQYDPLSGEGKRSHPFTGWTSLVTMILSEKY